MAFTWFSAAGDGDGGADSAGSASVLASFLVALALTLACFALTKFWPSARDSVRGARPTPQSSDSTGYRVVYKYSYNGVTSVTRVLS